MKEHVPSPRVLMLTTIQLCAPMLKLSCAGNLKESSREKLQFGASEVYRKYRSSQRYYRSKLPEVLPEPSTANESWVLDSNGSSTGSRTGTTGFTGSTGAPSGTAARNFWSPVPLTKAGYWTQRKWHRKLIWYYRYCRYYRSPQRKYRPGGMNLFEDRW